MPNREFPLSTARTEYRGTYRCPCCGEDVNYRIRVEGDTERLEQIMIEEAEDDA